MDIELQSLSISRSSLLPKVPNQLSYTDAAFHINSSSTLAGLRYLVQSLSQINAIYYLSNTASDLTVVAFGLGLTWSKLFGYGILTGMAQGLETLVSQAFGAKQHTVCTILFYRSCFVSTLLMLLIVPLMLFSGSILGLVNKDYELMEAMNTYTTWTILSIYLNGLFLNGSSYLNGQGIYIYQLIAQLNGTIVNCILNYVFIYQYGMGLEATCILRTIGDAISCLTLIVIIIKTKCCDNVYTPFRKSYLNNSFQFFVAAAPIGCLLWIEFACFNGFILQTSFMSSLQQNANVILIYSGLLLYSFPFGISVGGAVNVGNSMGEAMTSQAKRYALVSAIILSIYLLIVFVLTMMFSQQFSEYFTDDPMLQVTIQYHINYMICVIIGDGFQAQLSGIVRGVGREKFGCYTFITLYLIIGQPLAYVFAFVLDLQLSGIYLAMIVCMFGYDIIQIWTLLANDWDDYIHQIHHTIQQH